MIKFVIVFTCSLAIASARLPEKFVVGESDVQEGSRFRESSKELNSLKGVYHFGDSESEWAVAIIPYQNGFIVQTSSVFYSESKGTFLRVYSTMKKIHTGDGVFLVPKPHKSKGFFRGRFIEKKEDPKVVGIMLDGNSLHPGKDELQEVGFFSRSLEDEFGDHFRLSCAILDNAFLARQSANELSLLRNEIYAFYGMIFNSESLQKHFSKKEWYRPWRNDVNDCISELEWENIRLIRAQELSRGR